MARVTTTLALAIFLAFGLQGCVGDGADGIRASDADAPLLSPGIVLDEGDVVEASPTRAAFRWTSSAPVQPPTRPDLHEPTTNALTLPGGVHHALRFVATWSTNEDLDFVVRDGDVVLCQGKTVDHPETCRVAWLPADNETRELTIELRAYVASPFRPTAGGPTAGGAEVPFEFAIDVRPTGPYGVPPPDWEETEP